MDWLVPHLVHTLMILASLLCLSDVLYRILRFSLGNVSSAARPRAQKTAFLVAVVLAFVSICITQPHWFGLVSTPLAVLGAWGIVKLFFVLTDRFKE